MERYTLLYKSSRISYLRFGSGQKPVFCFHGYGEEAVSFFFLGKYAIDQYSFYALDLPFHGQTEWNEGLNCSTSDIIKIVRDILDTNDRKTATGSHPPGRSKGEGQQLSLIGFSLGGRVALSLYEVMPAQIEKLVLLAPDGLKVNFWYWLATQTWGGNKLFAMTMKNPGWFFAFLKMLNKLGLVNSSIFKFVNYYIGDSEVRRLLYARWTTLQKLKPGLAQTRSYIRANKTPVRLVYGKHDRIILPVRGEKFMKGLEEYCTLSVIHSGHQVLHEKHAAEILSALLH